MRWLLANYLVLQPNFRRTGFIPRETSHDVLLPDSCSARVDGVGCRLPPTHVVSVQSIDGEYMLAVVCDDHKKGIESRLRALQDQERVPRGKIHFQPIATVVTDCVTGIEEDYIEIELKRGIESDKKP